MADQGPIVALYGVADFALRNSEDQEQLGALTRWIPTNSLPEEIGWYDRLSTFMDGGGLGFVRPLGSDGDAIDLAHDALAFINELPNGTWSPGRQLHAMTAAMRAYPEQFRNDTELRDLAVQAIQRLNLPDDLPRTAEDASAIVDLYVDGLDSVDQPGVRAEWVALKDASGLDVDDDPPCVDGWTIVDVRNSSVRTAEEAAQEVEARRVGAATIKTSKYVPNGDLELACEHYLEPANWLTCGQGFWEDMTPCSAAAPRTVYIEKVKVDGFTFVACLEFWTSNDDDGKGCRLQFDMCEPVDHDACWEDVPGAIRLTVDNGWIRIRENEAGGIDVKTAKAVRFEGTADGLGGAAIACALGYGDAANDMATKCTVPGHLDDVIPSGDTPTISQEDQTQACC